MYNNRQRDNGLYSKQVLGATERAMGRAAAIAHEDLKRGLNTLATIICVAPLAGVFGTIWALSSDTFRGIAGERTTLMAALAERISWAVVPTALGIAVGLQAFWIHRYLVGRLADCEGEIETAALGFITGLVPHIGLRSFSAPVQESGDSLPYLEAYSRDSETHSRFGALITTVLLLAGFCVQMAVRFQQVEFDPIPLNTLIVTSLCSVMMMFCCACLPVYAVWVDLLHRKPGGVGAPVAAALSLTWCLAGWAYPALRF
jgi:hypothetical protein